MRPEEKLAEATRHATALSEHFDSVQIVATFRDDEGYTHTVSAGQGNYFARYGSVVAWVKREDAEDMIEDEEDD